MTIFEKRQLKIAKRTLRMNNKILAVIGSMTKEEANRIVTQHKIKGETYNVKH